ncbi:MAG TPA: hypothetical protein DCL61_08130, partial [Cyanobacteria bacterium UBA12227]|nr:hypothetical protein [Cyanobacteria bacterium UBA12227]
LDQAVEETPRLREEGVYLITGGLGAIGLTLASHLAKTVRAKLVLTGRSPFPTREDWSKWLRLRGEDDDISRKIRKVQQIEALGAEVLIVSADVSNLEQMRRAIAQVRERFGQLNGVIHAAGILGDSAIARKTALQVESVLAPKVKGALVLDALLNDVELDFLVLCSSGAAIQPLFGQVAYAGANNFLDVFAHYKTSTDGTFAVSINWEGWQESGMGIEGTKRLALALGRTMSQPESKPVLHPLFDRYLVDGNEQEIYISNLSDRKHWVLDEHRLAGKATLPGTAYLELIRAACENHAQNKTIEIRQAYFLTPLVVEDGEEKEVRTILKKRGDRFEFAIVSQLNFESDSWQEHAIGEVAFIEAQPQEKHELQAIKSSCNWQELIITEQDLKLQTSFVEYGSRWNAISKQVKLSNEQGLILLEMPEVFATDLNFYKLHPALLDVATGFLTVQYEGTYLPFCYKNLRIKGCLSSQVYSHIKAIENNQSQNETLKFNITVMDEQGITLIEIEEYTLRKIERGKADVNIAKQSGSRHEKTPAIPDSQNFYLSISSPGILDTLTFQPTTRQKPEAGEVEIEVSTTGLNFKEVLIALGLIPIYTDSAYKFGFECAGKIVALGEGVEDFEIGDEVIAFAPSCFSRFTTTSAQLVAPQPTNLSLEEAVTIPVAFTTAYTALIHFGRLCRGEKILIHAAAGGVGLAPIQIAQWVGAEILVTAGSPEKREFLRSLGIKCVMDSRSLAFADEVMKHTNGKGVDVVLNSLGGEFIPKSLSVLAPYGRFLELGQRDIFNNSQLGLKAFEKHLSFFAIQADPKLRQFNFLWHEVVQHFKEGNFKPLPHQVFPVQSVAKAFECMAGA